MSDKPGPPENEQLRNTLYRKVTRGGRKLTRTRLLGYKIAAAIAYWLVKGYWATCRVRPVLGRDLAAQTVRESKSVIPVYWHQHMLFGVHALLDLQREGLKLGFLISPSIDGTGPSILVRKAGAHVIRGSSTHTGARALRDYYETIVKKEVSPAITPDGPKGPVHEFKPGAVMLSQMTGKPILPVSIAATRSIRFKTWDAFELPLPFSRVAVVYGEPVKLKRGMNAEELAQAQADMANVLRELRAQARQALHPSGR